MIGVNVGVKCRFVVGWFNGNFQDLDTYVSSTSRSGQRLANAVAAENVEFILFSFDVGRAFAKGMRFEEFSALFGQDVRAVEFVFKDDADCLRDLLDF